VTKRHQPLCAQAGNLGMVQAWMRIGILVALGCVAAPVSAQNCSASYSHFPWPSTIEM
jgi:hypothetical protein